MNIYLVTLPKKLHLDRSTSVLGLMTPLIGLTFQILISKNYKL